MRRNRVSMVIRYVSIAICAMQIVAIFTYMSSKRTRDPRFESTLRKSKATRDLDQKVLIFRPKNVIEIIANTTEYDYGRFDEDSNPPQQEAAQEELIRSVDGRMLIKTIMVPKKSDACFSSVDPVYLLILVMSSPHRQQKLRNKIRQTWGQQTRVYDLRILIQFVFGRTENTTTEQILERESVVYEDIIQGDFNDKGNSTGKTVFGISWAAHQCPSARFVMKTNADVFVNIENLVDYLTSLEHGKIDNFVASYVFTKDIQLGAVKQVASKFPKRTYVNYPDSRGYIMSGAVARNLNAVFHHVRFIDQENLYIGVCLQNLGVELVNERRFKPQKPSDQTDHCQARNAFIIHPVTHYDLGYLWSVYQKLHEICR